MTTSRRLNRRSRRRMLWLIVAVAALALIAASVPVWLQWRQDHLNHQLIQAVKNLDAPSVNRLLDEGARADAHDTGESPLTAARLLARVLARFQNRVGGSAATPGNTALELLLNADRLDWEVNKSRCDAIAALLIRHGADIRVHGIGHRTLLREAARCGLHQTLDLLLLRGADTSARDDTRRTPLMGADAYSTSILIHHGLDANAKDAHKMTALFYARDIDVARILIQHGASVNLTDNTRRSLLYHAQVNDRQYLIPLLVQHGARLTMRERYLQRITRGE